MRSRNQAVFIASTTKPLRGLVIQSSNPYCRHGIHSRTGQLEIVFVETTGDTTVAINI